MLHFAENYVLCKIKISRSPWHNIHVQHKRQAQIESSFICMFTRSLKKAA